MMTQFQEIFYPESRRDGLTAFDGTVAFYGKVNALIKPESTVLDVGCGRGAFADDKVVQRRELRIFKGKCRKVIGVDIDPGAKDNPFVDEFHAVTAGRWPVADGSVDVCICDNVLEHVQNPDFLFVEAHRVLRPGGWLCIRTPNVFSYFGLASRLIRSRARQSIIERAQNNEREQEDVFPAFYSCNTQAKIRNMLRKFRFDYSVYGFESEPRYLSFNIFLYFLGVLHQRFAPDMFKLAIFAFARKIHGTGAGKDPHGLVPLIKQNIRNT